MQLSTKSLDFLTRCLSNNSSPTAIDMLRANINSNYISWEEIVALANDNLLVAALWLSLRDKNLADEIPPELREYLQELHALNTQRNEKLKYQLIEAIQALNQINIAPVLLKGSAYLFLKSFGDIGTRIMYDLDILVPKEKLQQCVNQLKSIDYRADPELEIKFTSHHHWAPLFRPGDFAAIELHHTLLEKSAEAILPTEAIWSQPIFIQADNSSASVLSHTHIVLHSILHSQVVDRFHDRHIIKLRALYDLAIVLKTDYDNVDWAYVKHTMEKFGLLHVLRCHLYHAHKFFGLKIPENLRPNLRCYWYYFRCMAIIRWEWMENLEHKLQNYSRYAICRRYACEDRWLPVTIARYRYSTMLIMRSISNFTRKLTRARH